MRRWLYASLALCFEAVAARAQTAGPIDRITDLGRLRTQLNTAFGGVQTPICTNAAGDGARIQAAVATGSPVHIVRQCLLDQPITFTVPGQEFYGDDRTTSVLNVSTVLTTGALIFPSTANRLAGTAGPNVHDIGISFSQANSSTRAGLIAFTPAVYAQGAGRFKLTRVRISEAMIGVDYRAGNGGATIDDLEVSCTEVCVWLDGITDTVKLHALHIWPFNLPQAGGCGSMIGSTTGLCTLYATTNLACTPQSTSGVLGPIGVYSGRMDDLVWSDSLVLIGQGACFVNSSAEPATGATFGTLNNVDFDSYNGIVMNGGTLASSSMYFSAIGNNQAIVLAAGLLQCASCTFEQAAASNSYPEIQVSSSGGYSTLILSGSFITTGSEDTSAITVDGVGAFLNVAGLQWLTTSALSFINPKICIACTAPGAILVAHGVQPTSLITSGTLMKIKADSYHNLTGNGLLIGWVNSCPAITHAVYANNGSGTAATCN